MMFDEETGFGRKWVVVWQVKELVQVPCPDYKPDPYTGTYPPTHCLVFHGENVTKDMKEYFNDVKDAIEFIANAPDGIRETMKMMECW